MEWQTTSTILSRLRNGDEETVWTQFVQRFRRPVVEFCRKAGLSQQDAEDVAQETLLAFVTSFRGGKYDRDQGRLSTWLFGIAYFQILKQRQKSARRAAKDVGQVGTASFWMNLEDDSAATQLWESTWEETLLDQCLSQARREFQPATYRAFELAVQDSRPAAEAAEELNVPVKTIYNAKHRVLERLRELRDELESAAMSEM